METRKKKKKESFTPVLDAILHGGSSVSLNMIDIGRHFNRSKCLFKSNQLNDAVIFKFPNFQEEISAEAKKAFGGPGSSMDSNPIETGIYLPYSTVDPDDGGCAIYLRQKNYQQLLLDTIGATPVYPPGAEPAAGEEPELPPNVVYDLKLLKLLDSIPTLDPFLLKECLDAAGVEYDSSILRLDPNEEAEIRRLISEKISPIIQKAFQAGDKTLSNRDRLLEALWDPTMPEAKAFVSAFGIKESEEVEPDVKGGAGEGGGEVEALQALVDQPLAARDAEEHEHAGPDVHGDDRPRGGKGLAVGRAHDHAGGEREGNGERVGHGGVEVVVVLEARAVVGGAARAGAPQRREQA